MDPVENVLEHFGVKGMKWGVRGASNAPPASDDANKAEETKRKVKAGGTKALSNAELQTLVTRINLEQQFHRLNPSKSKKALQFVADILIGVGKQQAIKVVNDVATKQISAALKKSG